MALFAPHGIYPVYGYGSYIFGYFPGSVIIPFPGSLGEMSGDCIFDHRDLSAGARGRDLLDGILSRDRPPGGGGRQRICGGKAAFAIVLGIVLVFEVPEKFFKITNLIFHGKSQ